MPSRRILIADRDPVVVRELEAMISRLQHEVAGIARSGAEAMAMAADIKPAVVLLQLTPAAETRGEPSSLTVAATLRERLGIPVVFTADEANATDLRGAEVSGSSRYLLRPFAEREVRVSIDLATSGVSVSPSSRELEDRFFTVSIDLLCLLDFGGHFKRLNVAWERTLGFSREELMARPFIEFVHPDDRERTLSQNAAVRSGGQALSFENRYLCKDGSFRWLLWNAAPDAGDRVIYSVARDVTARKEAEAERERLVSTLQTALAEVRSLQAIIPICSYCRKLRDDENYWLSVEGYVSRHTNSRFSHSICPSCYVKEVEPQFEQLDR